LPANDRRLSHFINKSAATVLRRFEAIDPHEFDRPATFFGDIEQDLRRLIRILGPSHLVEAATIRPDAVKLHWYMELPGRIQMKVAVLKDCDKVKANSVV
jgi:hypothetical protein